jgi:cell division protein FtsW
LQALGGFAYFALSGGGGLLAAHVLVSWGTNLGFLPVMGQPMPLLSAAGSHLIFLVLPLVALALALEEGGSDAG